MSLQSVREFLAARDLDIPIIEMSTSTATVALAAEAHGVEPGRIAKTLAFRLTDGRIVLLVTRGDARIDNRKFKAAFGKGRMLPPEELERVTGHPVG
ncbi:MAG: YbaK/EbsC family protein, partial [Gemmatimonadales bacterium]|nr:YbaK/EbsC family protein [Gemmatimonadales bacterium]